MRPIIDQEYYGTLPTVGTYGRLVPGVAPTIVRKSKILNKFWPGNSWLVFIIILLFSFASKLYVGVAIFLQSKIFPDYKWPRTKDG